MATRPAFQHQGPDSNCVIDAAKLGWLSCTAYAMAMLIDASTGGARRPKGCRVRRLVAPENIVGGLTLGQVAEVAEQHFGVPIERRTSGNTIPVDRLARRISRGWGFLLQGNNSAFANKGSSNHAIYIHEVRGGTPEAPQEALVYDSQRHQATWIPWRKVVAFGEALRPDEDRPQTIPPGRVWAGFGPEPETPPEGQPGPVPAADRVRLAFGAAPLGGPDRLRADPPPGMRINVRDTPRKLGKEHVMRTLGGGDTFVAFQKVTDGAVPPGARRGVWFGNRSGERWVHRSGVRGVERPARPLDRDPDLALRQRERDDEPPADTTTDETAGIPEIRNGDLTSSRDDPTAVAATSDPDPAAAEADFQGRPLTDEEVAALPVEETDGV